MSFFVTRPPVPVPGTTLGSTPCSAAIRATTGDTKVRPLPDGEAEGAACGSEPLGATAGASADGATGSAAAGGSATAAGSGSGAAAGGAAAGSATAEPAGE